MDKLKDAGKNALGALGKKAMGTVSGKVGGLTDKLGDVAGGGGGGGGPVGQAVAEGAKAKAQGDSAVGGALKGAVSGVKDKITGGGGKGGKGSAKKPVNIYETIDVGVPLKVAYNQWTEYEAFTSFTRKVEKASAQEDESPETSWGAKIFLSHREWKATTVKQVPDERIVWVSEGPKGYPNGSVTFHELSPTMTRIVLVIEYHPKGLFEKTGNIWRAQGRRVRADFKQFPRHVMTRTILHADEVEGWRGTIEDKEVVESHEDAVEREQQEADDEAAEQEESEDEYDDSEGEEDEYDEDEEGEEPAENEYEEGEEPEAEEGEEPQAEEGEEPAEDEEGEEPEAEDEYAAEEEEESEEEEEEQPRRRKRRAS